MIQKGDSYYHCFGCGAHGDAIQFLMTHQKLNFSEAIESLAQRFHVHLEQVEKVEEQSGPSKSTLKEALHHATHLYHFYLLHTSEGHEALRYLYSRGIDLDFIRLFQIGLAPKKQGILRKIMHAKGVYDEVLIAAGLLSSNNEKGYREFFSSRITFPIRDPLGATIGFSARKYQEDTYGGKYVNTPETALFKKSRVLFGLNYCRKRIAKEKKVIIVEGQIDALRLIQAGFNITVAAQGTAFGEGHLKELLNLGVLEVYLALDADQAGQEAIKKTGNLFQKVGIEVCVVNIPPGEDPDSFLKNHGPPAFLKLLENSIDYLTFLVKHHSSQYNLNSPASKNQLIELISKQIREWDHPLMVHESLRKLAYLTQVSENMIGVENGHTSNLYIKKTANIGLETIDPDLILETDFLRWLILMGQSKPHFIELAKINISYESLHVTSCRHLYQAYLNCYQNSQPTDLISLSIHLEDAGAQQLLSDLLQKIVNKDKADQQFQETIQKILERNWMELREEIKMKIHSAQFDEEEVLKLAKQFNELRENQPKVKLTP